MDEILKKAYIRETLQKKRVLKKFYIYSTWIIIIALLVLLYKISNIYLTLCAILLIVVVLKTDFFKPIIKLKIFDFYRPDLYPIFWDCPNCNNYMTLGGSWKCDKCYFVNTTENNNNSYPRIYSYCNNCLKLQETAICEHCQKEFII